MEPEPTTSSRDGVILRIMGFFFASFGVLVAIGLFWPQSVEARWVSGAASLALILCGGVAFWFGRPRSKD